MIYRPQIFKGALHFFIAGHMTSDQSFRVLYCSSEQHCCVSVTLIGHGMSDTHVVLIL